MLIKRYTIFTQVCILMFVLLTTNTVKMYEFRVDLLQFYLIVWVVWYAK